MRLCGSQRTSKPNFPLWYIHLGYLSREAIPFSSGEERSGFVLFCFSWNGLYWYLFQKCWETRFSLHHLDILSTTTGLTQAFYRASEARGWVARFGFCFYQEGTVLAWPQAIHCKTGAWVKRWDFSGWSLLTVMGDTCYQPRRLLEIGLGCCLLSFFGQCLNHMSQRSYTG